MSRDNEKGDDIAIPEPRSTTVLFGHRDAEQTLLSAYRSGHLPHAWLIGGPPGIGKATLAYRMARFVLTHPDQAAPSVQSAETLAVSRDHGVCHRIAARAHTDLLVLERGLNESGTLRTVITVDEVRRTVSFFGSTAGEGGWRVCVIDTADDLNAPAANALLKVLEEPPAKALFLLVSNTPGRLLPTIRSRCRRLDLHPLALPDVISAAATASGCDPADAELAQAAALGEGSVAHTLQLLDGDSLRLRRKLADLLDRLPSLDERELHTLSDSLGRANEGAFEVVMEGMRNWLSAKLDAPISEPARLARVAEVWDKLSGAARDVETLNLERKPMIFAAFSLLAEAARP